MPFRLRPVVENISADRGDPAEVGPVSARAAFDLKAGFIARVVCPSKTALVFGHGGGDVISRRGRFGAWASGSAPTMFRQVDVMAGFSIRSNYNGGGIVN